MECEQWIDQRQRIADGSKLSRYGDSDRDQQRRFQQIGKSYGDGGKADDIANDFFGGSGVQSINDCDKRNHAMYGDSEGNGKFQLDGDVDGERRHD